LPRFDQLIRSLEPYRVSKKQAALAIFLFVITAWTTTSVGALYMWNFRHGLPAFAAADDLLPFEWIFGHPREWVQGLPFSVTLLTILLAHELGHWLLCARHRIVASWPYFLPAPTLSGTAGAMIRIRYGIPSLDALMDVGISGPVCGFVVTIPATLFGLLLSKTPVGPPPPSLIRLEAPLAMQILYAPMRWIMPAFPPIDALLWHPVLIAAWVGLFITAMNLIPAGQLDGGHIVYAISNAWHRRTRFVVPAILLVMGVTLWVGWILWGLILLLPAMRHSYVPLSPELSRGRQVYGWLGLFLLVLTFLPAPFANAGLLEFFR
jgi:Zn-dependent protease